MRETFVTAINCIDGRVQEPLIEFAKREFKIDYVDTVTEAGPDKVLSENKDINIVESIKRRALISIEKHKSKVIIIAGHHDCAGNPVGEEEHRRQLKKSAQNIKQWNLGVDVYAVWVDKDWRAALITNKV